MKKYIFLPFLLGIAAFLSDCQRDPYREGARLYKVHCSNCHGENGIGLGGLIPPLAGSDFLKTHRSDLACILSKGLTETDTLTVNGQQYFGQAMPANPALSEFHVANLLNYINSSWDNQNPEFKIEEVRAALSSCTTR